MKLIFIGWIFALQVRADLAPLHSSEVSNAKAVELLKASDVPRGAVAGGMSWKAKLTSVEDGESSTHEFMVKSKDVDALAEATSPVRNKGELYLFNDRTMWFFKPSLKKPVPISARQKLSGQAAVGDIASTNYARDYTPTFEKAETENGKKAFVLFLKAKSSSLTYDQIRYWVTDKEHQAIKAEFLTLQGKAFKRARFIYGNQLTVNGQTIPFVSEMQIEDVQFPENKSTISYENPRLESHSASTFDVNALKR